MITGALILLLGMAIGGAIVYFYTQKARDKPEEKPKENPYDKYKNQDGLYSRSAVKSAQRS
jgi:alpha-glucuronidase